MKNVRVEPRGMVRIACLMLVALAPAALRAQNYSTPAGGGTLSWQETSTVAGSCHVGSPSGLCRTTPSTHSTTSFSRSAEWAPLSAEA
jgi:hypothetical protein